MYHTGSPALHRQASACWAGDRWGRLPAAGPVATGVLEVDAKVSIGFEVIIVHNSSLVLYDCNAKVLVAYKTTRPAKPGVLGKGVKVHQA